MKKLSSKGFTLIELLVVITIIGILATGATAVYTSAQQKARDSIRQNDVLAVRSAVEQRFGDAAVYPQSTQLYAEIVTNGKYMQDTPDDPKSGQSDSNTKFLYAYASSQDQSTNVAGQEYEISANFENTGNASSKEVNAVDGGNDAVRWEIGVNMDHVNTCTLNATCTGDTSGAGNIAGTNTYGNISGSAGVGNAVAIDGCTSAGCTAS
jgi:general secretion pathway protein G